MLPSTALVSVLVFWITLLSLNRLQKKVHKKKTRRGKKKNRKFLKKFMPVCDPLSFQQQVSSGNRYDDKDLLAIINSKHYGKVTLISKYVHYIRV